MNKSIDIYLNESEMPDKWYNFVPFLPKKMPAAKNHETDVCSDQAGLMQKIRPKELLLQDHYEGKYIKIPGEVRDRLFQIGRPTPLRRAAALEKYLGTPAHIYFKREDLLLTGSFKLSTAIPQLYYARNEGFKGVVSETGAGQWGMALALSSKFYGLECNVFMAKCSLEQKPYRKIYMDLLGAEVIPSPSILTSTGRDILMENKHHAGTLGTAISDAVAYAKDNKDFAYLSGSNTTHVLIHQTLLGLETKKQMEKAGEKPDMLFACISGGSNLGGFMLPFIEERMNNEVLYIGAESSAAPRLTQGNYEYDYSDYKGYTPLVKSYTMGHSFIPDPVHAGGLRQHSGSPVAGLLRHENLLDAKAYSEKVAFEAAKVFLETEGVLVAPETSHAVAAVIETALELKRANKKKNLVMLCSGSGMLDLEGYKSVIEK